MTTTAPSADELRRLMTERLVLDGTLVTPVWRDAFHGVPRHVFVPDFTMRTEDGKVRYCEGDPNWLPAAYNDASLVTQVNTADTATSSSTAPSVMARMLEATGAQDGDTVLEVGTGTGYNAALLSHRLGSSQVTSIDVDPALVDSARHRLAAAGYAPTLVAGDGMAGHPQRAPYDRLLATCGVSRIPDPWRRQVRPHGTIVTAVGYAIARLTVSTDRSAEGHFLPQMAAFMAARDTTGSTAPTAAQLAGTLATAHGRTRTITLPVGLDTDTAEVLGSLAHPKVTQIRYTDAERNTVRCLYDPETESWARLTIGQDPGTARLDHDGPRDLWAEREPLILGWATRGRPGLEDYGLSVDTSGTHTLWLHTPTGPSWPLT